MPKISYASSLSYDQIPGAQVGAFSGKTSTLLSQLDEQVIVGLRSAGEMAVILPATNEDQTAAQQPVLLAHQWTRNGVDARIKDFSLLQDPDTLLTQVALIVNACPQGGLSPVDMLVVAQNLSPCDRSAWLSLASSSAVAWVFDGAMPGSAMNVADLVAFLPQGSAQPAPLTLAVAGRSSTTPRLAMFAPGLDGIWQAREDSLPDVQQAVGKAPCVALSSGVLGGRAAVFALTDDDAVRYATVTPNALAYATVGTLNVPTDIHLSAIGTLHDPSTPDGFRLYAVGNGLYRWDERSIAAGSPPDKLLGPITDLAFDQVAVSAEAAPTPPKEGASNAVAILARTSQGDLYFCRDWIAGDSPSELPMVIANDVASVTAVRTVIDARLANASRFTAAVSFTDGTLQMLERDLADSASPWTQFSILVPLDSDTACVEQYGYSVRVQLVDDDQVPLACDAVTITALSSCHAVLNGSHTRLPRGVPIRTFIAPDGVLSLSVPSSHLDCPRFAINATTESATQPLRLNVDPAQSTQQKLRDLQTASDIVNAKDCYGRPVFASPPSHAGEFVTFLRGLFAMHDEAHGTRGATSVKAPRSVALHRSSAGIRALTDVEAGEGVADVGLGTVVELGTLLMTLWGARKSIQALVQIRAVGDVSYFTVQLGKDAVYSALWTFAGQATSIALTWVVERFLDLAPEKVVGWLGWVFDWDAVDQIQQGASKLLRLSTDYIEENAAAAIEHLDAAVAALESGIRFSANLSDAQMASPIFKQTLAAMGTGSGASSALPVGWAAHSDAPALHHITRKFMDGVTTRSLDVTQLPDIDLSPLIPGAQALAAPLESLAAQLQPVFDNQDILQMSLADLMKAIARASFDKLTADLKEAYRQLLRSLKTLIDASRKSLEIPVNVPVLNHIWTEKLRRTEPMGAADFLTLSAACSISFIGRATGVPVMNEQQLRVILDPANKSLPDIVSGLTPRSLSRSTHSGLGASGGKPVAPASVYYISGIFQCLTGAVGMIGSVIAVYQFHIGRAGTGIDDYQRFGTWLKGGEGDDFLPTWENAYNLRAITDLCTAAFGAVLIISSLVLSSKKSTVWYVLFAIWTVMASIYFVLSDLYTLYRQKSPAIQRLEWLFDGQFVSNAIQVALGVLGLLLTVPATVLMGLEPNVPVEWRDGMWGWDVTLTGLINIDLCLVLIAFPYTKDKTSFGTLARRFVGGSLVFIYTAVFAKGLLEFFMANTVAYADVAVRSLDEGENLNQPLGFINVFAADGSGDQQNEEASIDLSNLQPPSALNGTVYALGRSWRYASSGFAGFNAVVAAVPGELQGFIRSGAIGQFLRLKTKLVDFDPARAAKGPRGLYVVNVARSTVELLTLPLDFDKETTDYQTVASGLNDPSGICVGVLGNGLEAAERIFVADGAAIRLFDASGTETGSLAGASTRLSNPYSLAVDASNTWLIVADKGAGLLKFRLSDTGDVEPTAQWTFAPDRVTDVATDTMGNIVYTVPDAINFMSLETPSGADPVPERRIGFKADPSRHDSGRHNIIGLAFSA